MTREQIRAALLVALLVGVRPWWPAVVARLRPAPTPTLCAGWAALAETDGERLVCVEPPAALPDGCTPSRPLRAGDRLRRTEDGACSLDEHPLDATVRLALGVPLDVNREPASGLEALPGVGPALARKIVQGRPYASLADLERVRGIGPKKRGALAPFLRVEPAVGAAD